MNRIYNTWIFIISMLTIPFAFLVGINQIYGAFGANTTRIAMQYQDIVFGIAGVLIFMIGAFRSSRKWSGIRIVNQIDRYQFTTPISKERKERVITINLIEILGFFLLGLVLVIFSIDAIYIALIFCIFIIDSFLNTLRGIYAKKYRVGMTRKAIVSVDREVIPIYFKGLKKITLEQGILYFEYVNDLVIDLQLATIPEDKIKTFLNLLRKNVDDSQVYFSGFDK